MDVIYHITHNLFNMLLIFRFFFVRGIGLFACERDWAFWEPIPQEISVDCPEVGGRAPATPSVPDLVERDRGRGNLRAEHGTGEQVYNLAT
jgi:hypothetical protein